jgi:hypothetical protein
MNYIGVFIAALSAIFYIFVKSEVTGNWKLKFIHIFFINKSGKFKFK